LKKQKIKCEEQKPIKIYYENIVVGEYTAGIVVENKIILELKATKKLGSIFEAQLLNYLKATKLSIGYLINFGNSKVEYKKYILSA